MRKPLSSIDRDDYPDKPGFRRDGPSREAAEAMATAAKAIGARMLSVFKAHPGGLTVDEASRKIGLEPWKGRPRASELVASGAIQETCERRRGESGRWVTVWRVASREGGAA